MTYRAGAVSIAIRVWAQADPQTAVSDPRRGLDEYPEIIAEIRAGRAGARLVRNGTNLAELRKFLHGLALGIPRQRALAAYVRAMIQTQGADAVLRWAESLPDRRPRYTS